MRRFGPTLLSIALSSSIAASASPTPRAPVLHILFVGNSLTYTNDLPGLVKQIAELDGRRIEVTTVAFPDFSLQDHLRDRRTRAVLGRQAWDLVVLQQGPSAQESSRQALLRDARALTDLVRKKRRTTVAMLMVWPAHSRSGDFARVAESYRLAAGAIDGLLIPAGAIWQTVLREHADIELYASDGFHPSEAGSFLAALTVYRSAIGPLPEALPKGPVSAAQQRILVAAVEQACAQER